MLFSFVLFLSLPTFCLYAAEEENNLNSEGFTITVSDIAPGGTFVSDEGLETTNEVVNFVLGTIIQKLMIALGSLALIIMTI